MKVWMVTAGSYSAYGVVGLFATQELAEEYVRLSEGPPRDNVWHQSDFNPIKEMEVYTDLLMLPEDARAGRGLYDVGMDRDGNDANVNKERGDDPQELGWWVYKKGQYRGEFQITCWAEDAAHAIKIANETRTRLIAEGLFVPGATSKRGLPAPTSDTAATES